MQYPYTWTTTNGIKATVNSIIPRQYDFSCIANNNVPFSFTFHAGGHPLFGTGAEMTVLENEVYLEWCQISQTI